MELRKCPFCGSAPTLTELDGLFAVRCLNDEECPSWAFTEEKHSRGVAIESWNARPIEDALIAALRKYVIACREQDIKLGAITGEAIEALKQAGVEK